jgi:choline-glycine betaine transporter
MRAILMRWEKREERREKKKKVDDCSNTVLLCVKRAKAIRTSSAVTSIPFFLFFLFLLALLLASFSFMCSVTHSTVRRAKSKEKKEP